MSESGSRSNLVKVMKKDFDAVAIESPKTGIGIPDVNFTKGWIECKWMKSWPKNCDTRPVRLGHPLSVEQGIWAFRRSRAGGYCFVCVQIAREWFFFDGLTAKDQVGKLNRLEMREQAVFRMEFGMDKEALLEWLHSL